MLRIGRIAYAAAVVGFGVLCFGYVDFVHQLQPVPSWFPAYVPLALLTGVFLIIVGIALLANVRVSLAEASPSRRGCWRAWLRRWRAPCTGRGS